MKKLILFIILLPVCNLVFSQKDSIKLINNDIIIGEIKKMDRSVLTFKTAYSDSDFKIEWHKVLEIYSDRMFIISLTDGQRFKSTLESEPSKKGIINIDMGEQSLSINILDIVFIDPIGKNFFSRLTIDMDIGITITKANNLKQFNSNISATYLADKWNSDAYFKSVLSRQDGVDDISRKDGNISIRYFLINDWFVSVSGVYLSNDEQLLKLRSTYKVGVGYFAIHSNKMYLAASAGLARTSEKFIDDQPSKQSSEIYGGIDFNKYDIGDLSLLTSIIAYPSMTEKGRFRVDFNFDLKYDLPLDLYIKMGTTYNYDNKPAEGATKGDYVFQTSFGWEWN